jgi:CheY-like chemotaxis protein
MRNQIAIIDDNKIFSSTISHVVEQLGYQPLVCDGGFESLTVVEEHKDSIKAVLLDIYMPCIDGISVLGHFRATYPNMPVIMVSGAQESEEYQKNAEKLGAIGYIRKPFDPATIKDTLSDYLNAIS